MKRGSVKTVLLDRGFGFVHSADHGDLFFHINDLAHELDFDEQLVGRDVLFDVETRNNRLRAVSVRPAY